MPSDSNGLYSLPAGYLAVTGTTILASQHNPPLEDIEAGLTARLMRSGVAPMTGVLKLADGLVSAPGLAFNTAATTGLYKSTAGLGLAVVGAKVIDFGSSVSLVDGGDIASAAALTLGTGNIFNITGTTSITSIATKGIGTLVWLRFNGALTLTHHATDLILSTSANIVTAAGDFAVFEEYATGDWRMVGYHRAIGTALAASLPRGYISGCEISNGTDATNDINIGVGVCTDSTGLVPINVPATTGKQLDANWAPGGSAGMRDSAAGIANTDYYIYAVRTAASPTADFYAHTSPVAATALAALQVESGGASYIYARCIAPLMRRSAANVAFTQRGDHFELNTKIVSTSASDPGTSAVTATLVNTPAGIVVKAHIGFKVQFESSEFSVVWGLVSSLTSTDQAPTNILSNGGIHAVVGAGGVIVSTNNVDVMTNTATQVRYRVSSSNGNVQVYITAFGFTWDRGKDA